MARALIALLCGIVISFLLASILFFLSMKFRLYPFYGFYIVIKDIFEREGTQNYNNFFELAQAVSYAIAFAVFPIVSFITSLVTASILGKREFLLGIMSLLPGYIVLYVYPGSFSKYSIYPLITLILFSALGSYTSKALKRRRQRTSDETEHSS